MCLKKAQEGGTAVPDNAPWFRRAAASKQQQPLGEPPDIKKDPDAASLYLARAAAAGGESVLAALAALGLPAPDLAVHKHDKKGAPPS